MTDLPDSLPARMFLLAYDTHKQRMTGSQLGYVLRAAALTDLMITGALVDAGGKVSAQPGPAGTDPLLEAVRQQIAASRPRSWRHWVSKGAGPMKRDVREQLAAAGWIRVEPRRVLGLFPTTKVTVRDTRVVKQLVSMVSAALREPIGQVNPRDAALVALAASGELKIVLPRARRREHKERITRLTDRTGPAAIALRKVVQSAQAAAATTGTGG
jgi:Golgi phosphoprotein 3 (GPP34)